MKNLFILSIGVLMASAAFAGGTSPIKATTITCPATIMVVPNSASFPAPWGAGGSSGTVAFSGASIVPVGSSSNLICTYTYGSARSTIFQVAPAGKTCTISGSKFFCL